MYTGIFKANVLSPVLFVIAMVALTHILKKCIIGDKFYKIAGEDQSPN